MKQLKLITEKKYPKRKTKRAISLRGSNHIVLKAKTNCLRAHTLLICKLIHQTQLCYGVKLRAYAVMSDHLHLMIKVSNRKQFSDALKYLSSRIAIEIGHKRFASPQSMATLVSAKLWQKRAWSRAVTTRRDEITVERYIARNPIKAQIWSLKDSYFILNGVLQV